MEKMHKNVRGKRTRRWHFRDANWKIFLGSIPPRHPVGRLRSRPASHFRAFRSCGRRAEMWAGETARLRRTALSESLKQATLWITFLPARTTFFPGSLSCPSSLSLRRASWRKPWERGCPCVHLQNLTLHPWLAVSYRLWNQCPNEGRRETQIILKLALEGLGGMHFQNFYFWTEGYNFHMTFFCGVGGGGRVKFW